MTTTEQSAAGSPERTIQLLWGVEERAGKPGPKPRLTVDRITSVAVEVADAEGLPAVSMRQLAERLGVTAMTLYTYVPSKAELVDLMLDRVYAETTVPDADETGGDWRARLRAVALDNWARYVRHPWLLEVATSRPVLGPNEAEKYERELRAVEGIGLTDVQMDLVVSVLADYVHGAVRGAVEAAAAERDTGLTDEQWWQARLPFLEKVLDTDNFPIAARVGVSAGEEYGSAHDPARSFELGLQLILDGLAALLRRR